MQLEKTIRVIPDFPKKGVQFRDITTLLNDKKAFKKAIDSLAKRLKNKKVDYIVAAEARGFIFGSALAYKLNSGFIPVRKPGKLPYKAYRYTYSLEYGEDSLEIHKDAFPKNSRVVILDDLLATGGTTIALIKLVEKLKAKIIDIVFLVELCELKGRDKIKKHSMFSLIKY